MKTMCEDIRELLPVYVDEAASEAEQRRVVEHLAECAQCRREAERWAALDRLVAASLSEEEPAAAEEVEATAARVRAVRPGWAIAPTPVRFWRSWLPTGALAAAAVIIVLVALYSPWLNLSATPSMIHEHVAALASEPTELAASVSDDVTALQDTLRTWPQQAQSALTEWWSQGAALAQEALRHTGSAPLAVCMVLLLLANVAFARSAVISRAQLQEGSR